MSLGRRVGMADEADSKSVVGNYVWVQVPPPAVYKHIEIIPMIIFKRQYDKTVNAGVEADEELRNLLDEAEALVRQAGEGVKSERSPLTIVEKVQISDTTKLVQRLIIDINRDIKKGRSVEKNREKLKKATEALRTSILNIL